MAYVILDGAGDVVGTSSGPQPLIPGYTFLANDAPAYQAYIAAQAKVTAVAALLTAGCAIVSQGTPSISATYALDQSTMDQIGALARDSAAGMGFPLGAASFVYPDKTRTPRTFSAVNIQALYKALRDYIYGIDLYATGQAPSPPSQPVTIQ